MNTEDSEFARIEREQAMRGVPDPIHHTDKSETPEYITGWNDCRAAMLEQPAQQEHVADGLIRQYINSLVLNNPDEAANVTKTMVDYVYTTPQAQRKPLNVAEVEQIIGHFSYEIHGRARYIVRMTEAAHGIKEKNT